MYLNGTIIKVPIWYLLVVNMEWLKKIRKAKKLTQEQTAKLAGITRTYYLRIENGDRGKRLPFKTAKQIANALDFPVEKFNQEEI